MIFAILLLSSRSPRDVNSNLRFGTKLPKLEHLPLSCDFYLFLWVLGGLSMGGQILKSANKWPSDGLMSWSRGSGAANSQCSGHFESCSTFTMAQIRYEYESRRTMHSFSYSMSVPASQQGSNKKKKDRGGESQRKKRSPSRQQCLPLPPFQAGSYPLQPKSSWTASGPRSLGTTVKNCTGAMRYPRLKEIKDQHGLLGVGYPYMIYNIVSWLAPMVQSLLDLVICSLFGDTCTILVP